MTISDITDRFNKLRLAASEYDLDWLVYQAQWATSVQSAEQLLESFQDYHKNLCTTVWTWLEFKGYAGNLIKLEFNKYNLFLEKQFKNAEDLTHGHNCSFYNEHVEERLNLFLALSNKYLDGVPTHCFVYESDWHYEFSVHVDGGFCVLLINETTQKALLVFAEAAAC
jgi:hypothetical protein